MKTAGIGFKVLLCVALCAGVAFVSDGAPRRSHRPPERRNPRETTVACPRTSCCVPQAGFRLDEHGTLVIGNSTGRPFGAHGLRAAARCSGPHFTG